MAVTIDTVRTEVLTDLQDSSSSLHSATVFVADTNQFYSRYGRKMKLQGVATYTWGTSTTSVALTSINASCVQVNEIQMLDSDGNVTGSIGRRPKGHSDGFYIWNNSIYLNPNGEAPDSALSLNVFYYRTPTAPTNSSSNIDVHDGFERSVMYPWYMYKCWLRNRKPSMAESWRRDFENAFKDMMRDRAQQFNPDHDNLVTSDDYSTLTG